MDTPKPNTLMAAIMHFFGKKPGQTTMEFAAEVKALTSEDREELRVALKERGYPLPL